MIVIDMNIPTSCCECPMCHPKGKDEPWNYACFQGMIDINLDEWDEKRHPNCPIKCDIEDIKTAIIDAPCCECEVMDGETFTCMCMTKHDVLQIIDKYKGDKE